jgi:hypothetical protein
LYEDERDEHDPEERRDDQQEPLDYVTDRHATAPLSAHSRSRA